MSDPQKLAKGVFVNVLGMLTKISRVAYLSIFAHQLGQEQFGLYMLAFAISEVISKFAVFGLESGMMRLTGKLLSQNQKPEVRWILNRVLTVSFFLSILSTAAAWFASPWIAETVMRKPELTEPLRFFCLTIPGLSLTTTVLFSFRNTLDMKYENIIRSFFEPIGVLVLGFIFLRSGHGVVGLAIAHAMIAMIALVLSMVFFFRVFPDNRKPPDMDWLDLIRTSLPMGGMTLLNMFKIKVDLLIIGRLLPLSMTAIYAAVIEINQVVNKVKSLFDPILVPMVQSFHDRFEIERMNESLALGIRWVMTVVLVILGTVVLFPDSYLSFFGENFHQGVTALRIYAVGQGVVSSVGILENILAVTGYATAAFIQSTVMVAANMLLLLTVVPSYGLEGAAAASTICLVLVSAWRWVFLKKKMNVKMEGRSLLKPLSAFLIATALFYALTFVWSSTGMLTSIVLGIGFVLSYLFVLGALGFEPIDRDMFRKISTKFRR